jgi:hypothetical protein
MCKVRTLIPKMPTEYRVVSYSPVEHTEGLLGKVIDNRRVATCPSNDDPDATAVTIDQFGFGFPVAGHDAADEIGFKAGFMEGWSVHSLTFCELD